MQDYVGKNTTKQPVNWRNVGMWFLCLLALGAGYGAIFFFGLAR